MAKKREKRLLRNRKWCDKDDNLLKSLAGKIPKPEIAERMDRTASAVMARASVLGVSLACIKRSTSMAMREKYDPDPDVPQYPKPNKLLNQVFC